MAKACGYQGVFSVSDNHTLHEVLNLIKGIDGPIFLEIKVKKGARKDLGRPTTSPVQNKDALMCFLNRN